MRYLEDINTGYVAQHIAYMKPEDREAVRKQAEQRSKAFGNITAQSLRSFVLNSVVDAWFDSWYWRVIGQASRYAEQNERDYTHGSEREANWLLRFIDTRHKTLASEHVLEELQLKLNMFIRGNGISFKEIGDRIIEHANEVYACGVVGAGGEHERGLRVIWEGCELRHKFFPVNEPWY